MTSVLAEKISAAEKRLAQLRLQYRRREAAARAVAAKKDRAADTRRKILAGAIALSDPALRGLVLEALAQRLDRKDDRDLFGLGQQGGGNEATSGDPSGWPSHPADQHGGADDLGEQDTGLAV